MNLVMADVTELKDVEPGDEAVFLGQQGSATITGDEAAESCGTISYEIFCAVGQCGKKRTEHENET
jgi:alanine racemase